MIDLVACTLTVIAAVFLFKKKPFSRLLEVSGLWDIGLGVLLLITVIFYLTSTYVTRQIIEDDLAKQPCGEQSPQGRCYSLNRELCESLWEKANEACQKEVEEVLKAHPTALIGPAANRCKARQMDKAIRFNRIKADSQYCRAYFKFIDEQK